MVVGHQQFEMKCIATWLLVFQNNICHSNGDHFVQTIQYAVVPRDGTLETLFLDVSLLFFFFVNRQFCN